MKIKLFITQVFLLISLLSFSISYQWDGTISSDWNTNTNWIPNGVPGLGDDVTILNAPNNCVLDINRTIDALTITSGTLDLGGNILIASLNTLFNAGNVVNGVLSVNSGLVNICTLNNTSFSATLNIVAGRIFLNGGIYNAPTTMQQIGNTNTSGNGTATFNNNFSFILSGNGFFRTNGGNTFNGGVEITNNGGDHILFELNSGSIYNGNVILTNNSNSQIRVAYQGNSTFNGNIELNSTTNGEIRFCEQATASANFGAGVNLSIGGVGFDSGQLILRRITQVTAVNHTLVLGGITTRIHSIENNWGGNINFTAPRILSVNSIYNGDVYFEKTQNDVDYNGGNIVNGNTTIVHSGFTNSFRFGRDNPDIFNGDVTLINLNNGHIRMADNSLGNQINGNFSITNNSDNSVYICNENTSDLVINGNIEINSIGASNTIFMGNYGNQITLQDGFTITVGGLGFNTGVIIFRNFTQLGNTPQNITFTGTGNFNSDSSIWNGNLTVTSPRINSNFSVYNGTVFFEKNGDGNENCGGNIFNQNTTFVNSSPNLFRFGGNDPDIFNGVLNLRNTGTSTLEVARNSTGNEFNGNVFVENNNGNGIFFGNNGGTSTLADGFSIGVGGLGFTDGELYIYNLTQLGNTPQNITTGSNARIRIANSIYNANLNYISQRLLISYSEFNGITYFEKNGAGNDNSAGGNVFNGITTLVNSSTGYLLFGNVDLDIFNAQLSITNLGSEYIYLAHNSIGNQFNGNVILESIGSIGIRFGEGNGTSTLADGFAFIVGAFGYDSGELRLRNVTQLGGTPQNLTLTGTSRILSMESIWNGPISFISPRTYTRGSTYNNTVYWEKTGTLEDNCRGGNTFNADLHMVNSATDLLRMSANIVDLPDFYNGTSRFSSTGTSIIMLADYSLGNEFNGDVFVESVGSNGVRFGQNNGSATLSATYTISAGALGFDSGELRFRNFTQVGPTPQNVTLIGTGYMLHQESNWGGDVIFIAPRYYTRGTVYNGLTYIEKTGTTIDDSPGGNLFQQNTTIVNSGDSRLRFATNDPDIFNTNTFARNTGSSVIWLADNSVGNEFNGNIQVESVGSNGITFGRGGGGSATMAATFTVTVGPLGFDSGELMFNTFTQVGPTPQNVTLTGTGYFRNFESNWGGNVSFIAPRMYTRGTIYNGTTHLEKSGAVNDPSYGNNIFHQNTSLINSGTAYFGMGWDNPDVFNGDLLVETNNDGIIYMAHNSSGNILQGNLVVVNTSNNQIIYFNETASGNMIFNGNIELNSSITASGVRFGNQTINASFFTQAAGTTITIGAGGFHNGELRFVNFTKLGADAVNLTLTGDGYFRSFESEWNGNVTFISPRIYTRGTTYNGLAYLEKTGNTDDASAGNNVFNQLTTLVNSGIRYFGMGFTNPDIYNANLVLRNIGTNILYVGHSSTGNQYNGNIQLESTGASQGIRFHQGVGSGELAGGNIFLIGGLGFSVGELYIRSLNQLGGTPQNFTLTGTAFLTNHDSNWSGSVDFRSPRHITRGTIYQGMAYLEKTGAVNDASLGGNTFMQNVEFLNSGTGYFMPANTSSNIFLNDVTYSTTSTGIMYPTYNCESFYHGNININASNIITFAATTNGRVRMVNSASQTINDLGTSPMPIFRRLTIDKTGGEVTLNIPIAISVELELLNGVVFTDVTNLLIMNHNSNVAAVSDASHVNGPVRKIGNAAFTFPIGKSGFYRPASISAPANTAHHFTAEYFLVDPVSHGYDDTSLEAPIIYISDCEYWMINRTNGASNVTVNLSYRTIGVSGCSGVVDPSQLRVARWDGAIWRNHGNGGTFGLPDNGSIVTSGAVTAFSPFTLATLDMINPLPIELLSFDATPKIDNVVLNWSTASENNNDYFIIERSANGEDFSNIGKVQGAGNSSSKLNYQLIDYKPLNGISYYRLKQVDFNGDSSYSQIKSVYFEDESGFSIFPNPVKSGEPVYIDINNSLDNIKVFVYDVSGKLIEEKSINHNTIYIDLPSGVYFIQILTNSQIQTTKLIVEY